MRTYQKEIIFTTILLIFLSLIDAYTQLISDSDCNGSNGTCSPSYCERAPNAGCTSSIQTVNIQSILNTLSCRQCTQSTVNKCTQSYFNTYLKTGGGLKAVYCNDAYLVVISNDSPSHTDGLNNIPRPPGYHPASGVAPPYSDSCVYRYWTPTLVDWSIPLNPQLLPSANLTNNQQSFNPSNTPASLPGGINLPGSGPMAVSVSGQEIFPLFNNNGETSQSACELDKCNAHSAGDYHYHGDPYASEVGKCMYSMADYASVTSHPPVIGWSFDGYEIFGRHLSNSAIGFNVTLDLCGGHSHDDSNGNPYGYHYHTQVVQYTTTYNNVLEVYYAYVPGPFYCWRGNITLSKFFNTNGPLTTSSVDYYAMQPCCTTSAYYLSSDVTFANTVTISTTSTPTSVTTSSASPLTSSSPTATSTTIKPSPASTLSPTAGSSLTTTSKPTSIPTVSPTKSPSSQIDYSCVHASNWRVNENSHYNSYFSSYTDILGSGPSNSNTDWTVTYTGIPNYDRTFGTADITRLNSRPKASTDFVTGKTTAVAGNFYVWGTNIGYTTSSCNLGFWPPGPVCPSAYNKPTTFTLTPAPETSSTGCYTGLGAIGRLVNGVSMYGWSDGESYNSAGSWNNNAPNFEYYDMDPCGGHAAMGDYHQHFYPNCLAQVLGDTGTGHSPLYGFAFDGYPIYGPWQGAGELAVSCWQTRDYSASTSFTGCSGGARTCKMVNEFDYTQGTTTSGVIAGPTFTQALTTQSGNELVARLGIYYQDYYYNSTCYSYGGPNLNQYNGHSHGSYGFHYHYTMNSTDVSTFPYSVGPKYYGCITTMCLKAICVSPPCSSVGSSTCGTSNGVSPANAQCLTTTTSSDTYPPTPIPTTLSNPVPSANPTTIPSLVTHSPSATPTSISNTISPSSIPTVVPTLSPIISQMPTSILSKKPSVYPTISPTLIPSARPTIVPSASPTIVPSASPTLPTSVKFAAAAPVTFNQFLQTPYTASMFLDNAGAITGFTQTVQNLVPNGVVQITGATDSSSSRRLLHGFGLLSSGITVDYVVTVYIYNQTDTESIAQTEQNNIQNTVMTSISSGNFVDMLQATSSPILSSVTSSSTQLVTINPVTYVVTGSPTKSPSNSSSKNSNTTLIIAVVVGVVGGIIVISLIVFAFTRMSKPKEQYETSVRHIEIPAHRVSIPEAKVITYKKAPMLDEKIEEDRVNENIETRVEIKVKQNVEEEQMEKPKMNSSF